MSKRLIITTTVMDDSTGEIVSKQESIVIVDEEKNEDEDKPKNYFGINAGSEVPLDSFMDYMRKYGSLKDPKPHNGF